MKFLGIGDSSPPNTLPKQEGLQLAKASFHDDIIYKIMLIMLRKPARDHRQVHIACSSQSAMATFL